MRFPRILRDEASDCYFVAGPTGPTTWRYHRSWWRALFELWGVA